MEIADTRAHSQTTDHTITSICI